MGSVIYCFVTLNILIFRDIWKLPVLLFIPFLNFFLLAKLQKIIILWSFQDRKITRKLIMNVLHIDIVFPFFSICVGWEKKDTYDPDSIVGKWQIIEYPEYCSVIDRIVEITADSLFKSYVDGKIDFISTFNIKTGTLGYGTILYHDYADFIDGNK